MAVPRLLHFLALLPALCTVQLAGAASGSVFRHRSMVLSRTDDGPHEEPPFRADTQLTFVAADTGAKKTIDLEVPNSFTKFMEGLMWRRHLNESQGMIFRWDQDGWRSFWMENTYLALDLVYVNSRKKIVSIKKGEPLNLHGVPSDSPAKYCIEVPAGWCQTNGIANGDSVVFDEESMTKSYVASDTANFGATPAEVKAAVAAGVYTEV